MKDRASPIFTPAGTGLPGQQRVVIRCPFERE